MVTSKGIRHSKPNALRGVPFDETDAEARSPNNTPLTNRASTSANPNLVISPAFVEANYEVLESLLRGRRRHAHNKDIRTELDYYNEEYDEKREMEPRPVRVREATHVLRIGSPRARRHRGRVVEFEEAPNRDGSRVERESEGRRPLERRRGPWRKSSSANRNPLGKNLQPTSNGHMSSYVNPYNQSHASMTYNQSSSYPFIPKLVTLPSEGPLYTIPTEDGLKMPPHVGSYDGKGDPDNYLHLFEGAIRSIVNYEDLKAKFWSHFSQQKKFTKTHLVILGLHEEQRISGFAHGLKIRNRVKFLSTDLPTTYKGLMEKTYTWIEAKEVATNGAPNDHKEGFDKFIKGFSWDNNKGRKKNRDRFSLCKGSNHGLLKNLTKSPREILATKKVAKAFEQPPRMVGNKRSRDMSKYSHFHKDHGHETNHCRELRHQIEEAVKSG
ncbi:hypothetical protein Tco_1300429 [Tanacetum coccineum]